MIGYKIMNVKVSVPARFTGLVEAAMLKAAHHALALAYSEVEGRYDDSGLWDGMAYPCYGCAHEDEDAPVVCSYCSRLNCGSADQYEEA